MKEITSVDGINEQNNKLLECEQQGAALW